MLDSRGQKILSLVIGTIFVVVGALVAIYGLQQSNITLVIIFAAIVALGILFFIRGLLRKTDGK